MLLHLSGHYFALSLHCHLRVRDTSGSWEASFSEINGPQSENKVVEGVRKFGGVIPALPPPRVPPRLASAAPSIPSSLALIIACIIHRRGKRLNYAITIFAVVINFVRLLVRKMTSAWSFVSFFPGRTLSGRWALKKNTVNTRWSNSTSRMTDDGSSWPARRPFPLPPQPSPDTALCANLSAGPNPVSVCIR